MGTINAAAAGRVAAGDTRTADQRRADALVELVLGAGSGGGSAKPSVQVTVALSSLLGVDEQPGELDGHGPIPAALARKIAADPSGTWRRLVTDDDGRLLDYGRRTYRPPADLTGFVQARDRTCRFPNCNRSARRCQLDHIIAWNDGGVTSAQNLHALCSRHHHVKHETGWTVIRDDDGTTTWTSPTGRRYAEPAARYPTDQSGTRQFAIKTPVPRPDPPPSDPDPPF